MIETIINKRKRIYDYYDSYITNPLVAKPPFFHDASCIRYSIRTAKREQLYWELVNKGVDAGFSFRIIHAPSFFEEEHKISDEVLNLPFYYDISEKEVRYIVSVINLIRL